MAKYHLITYHPDCGDDDKEDLGTMKEVNLCAKKYLKDGYDEVRVFSNHVLVKVFDQYSKRGRKPFPSELRRCERNHKTNAESILSYLRNEGGFQYFCNTENWSVAQCETWVRENFPCSAITAEEVASEIVSWT